MINPTTQTVLITGATGGIGRQLLDELLRVGQTVRALCRRQQQVEEFQTRGVEAVRGDLGDRPSLEAAMAGVDRVFLLTFPSKTQREHGRNAVEAAVAAGVRSVVHLSTADANLTSAIPWASAPARTDAQLKTSGLGWTLLKPTAFMQNILQSAAAVRHGVLPHTTGRGVVGWIDTRDIAAVAAQVLTEPGHEGCEHVLSGPALLSMPDVAADLSVVTGHPVRYLHMPSPIFELLLRVNGVDAWTARGLCHQYVDVVRHGQDNGDTLTDTVLKITGRPPRSFQQFAQANRHAFVPTSKSRS